MPVYPAAAKSAGVHGAVIIEATIGADGTVQDTKVLRSVPQLDQARFLLDRPGPNKSQP